MALRGTAVVGFACVALALLVARPALAQLPGGFVELATSAETRPQLTGAQIRALLPDRGPFTFPAPYLTQGMRLTNASDCDGNDCVDSVGDSHGRNTNNHVGSDTMLIFLTLDRTRGGSGPTLFRYHKPTNVLTKVGPLFDPASPYSWASGAGWYFSATRPTTLYLDDGPRLLRYDVGTKTFETVLDVSTQPTLLGANRSIWRAHSSHDDRVHSATLRDGATFAELGCFAYREDTRQFFYFPQRGLFYDECQLDTSGRWLLIKEKLGTDPVSKVDNRIIDLTTGVETDLLDRDGAGGDSDTGAGYMIARDNRNPLPGAIRLWRFGTTPMGPGTVIYRDMNGAPLGVSHANAKAGVPPEEQYACGSGASRANSPRANEVICFPLDGSLRVLVVAPVMADTDAAGGRDSHSKLPSGNLDVTGQYYIWTSNVGGSRLDAFLVKVPAELLTGRLPDTTPPTVAITAPTSGAAVAGTVTVAATATDNVGVVGVQFRLDGADLGPERTGPTYSLSWDTTTALTGAHTLTAVARDAAGNIAVSTPVSVTVPGADRLPASMSSTAPKAGVTVRGPVTATATDTALAPGGVIFESNWDTAVGPSRTAVTDGGRWPLYWEFNNGDGVQLLSVVSGGPNGHNALRVQQRGPVYAANIQLDNFVLPSTDYYVRYYMRNDDTSSAGDHIVTVDTWQYPNLTYMRKYSSGSSWRFVVSMYGCGYIYPIAHWGPTQRLSHGQWYRFEYYVHYTNANHIRVYPRVYDAAGTLLFSDADFKQQDYNAGGTWNGRSDWTLASYYAAGFDFCVDITQLNRQGTGLAVTSFGMGNNGNFGAADTGLYWYFSALQIRYDTWPGPLGGGATVPLTFTDDPLAAQSTVIKALHILEARAAIDSVRLARGLAPFAWTDRVLISGSTPVKAIHLLELRAALNQAYQAAGRTPPAYTDPNVVAGQTILNAVHLSQLRTAVRALADIPIPGG